MVTLWLNDTYHISLTELFRALGVDNIMFLLSCLLTERRLIVSSSSLERLSECIHGLMAIIYPFRWQHIFVPILPEQLLNYLGAPMPFIIGIKTYLATEMTEYPVSEVVLVDLDKNSIRSSLGLDVLKPLPNDPAWKLRRELNRLLKKSSLLLDSAEEYTHSQQKKGNISRKQKLMRQMSGLVSFREISLLTLLRVHKP